MAAQNAAHAAGQDQGAAPLSAASIDPEAAERHIQGQLAALVSAKPVAGQ
jgi:hypothetical protein